MGPFDTIRIMELPDFLKPFQQEAELYLKKDLLSEIEFSATTYQVLVKDLETGRPIWTFLHLDKEGHVKDYFCDDEEGEDLVPCVHLAAAYLRIYNHHEAPLGERFKNSLWNQLCRLYADRLGDDPAVLHKEGKGVYTHYSTGGKLLFKIKAHTAGANAEIKEIFKKSSADSEDTSLKFSHLSQEELKLWREGNPSADLKYELSFWNDLAKLLMNLQDSGKPYQVSYGFSSNGIPNELAVTFKAISVTFYLSEANLPLIIPSLSTIESELKVYNAPEEEIKSITYDKKEGCLHVTPISKEKKMGFYQSDKPKSEEIIIDRWIFYPGSGFYAKDPHWLLMAKKICGKEISAILNKHFPLIQKFLQDTFLHKDPVEVSYKLAFDSEWNLRLTSYLFTPGDLSYPNSRCFGDWGFVDDEGFYKLEGMLYPQVETTISHDMVADFVSKNKSWLNLQEGFHVHSVGIDSQLFYEMSDDNRLSFVGHLDIEENITETHDFGSWVYVASQGFYSKETSSSDVILRSGMTIGTSQIPIFIKVNHEELEQVPGFMSQVSPLKHIWLDVEIDTKDVVSLTPRYELKETYLDKPIQFFEDFTFIRGEGFHEIPLSMRVPERYSHRVEIESENLDFFLGQELPLLAPYIDIIDSRLIKPKRVKLVALDIDKIKESGSPFEYVLELIYETDIGIAPVTDLWAGIKKKKKYLFTRAGLLHLHDKRFDWLRWLHKAQVNVKEGLIKLTTLELIRLYALDEFVVKEMQTKAQKRSTVLLNELVELKPPKNPELDGLKSPLRPYQTIGVHWLWFLYHYGLSGLLCDDMGLGKTHQTMALMAAIVNLKKDQGRTFPTHLLVVCPTSVIYHWQEKLKEHLPGMRVHLFHGGDRTLKGFCENYDILLTTYGICRIENEALGKIPFELAVFDEVQLAKNHNSRLYATLIAIQAKMRLGLTGTPIENHLRELKALFDIVLPSYMPSESDFREYFVKPIEKEVNLDRKKLLSRMIKPFVMRRKKQEVLVDLPEKIEEISHCDLLPSQASLYNEVLKNGRARILDNLHDENAPVPYVHIFSLLSGLKQICNHPAVYLKCPDRYKEFESGKWDLFVELLDEARESGQKVVIYTQYLAMLDIFENYLLEMGVGYASIRGATVNRGEQLAKFHKDPSCEVFLASLQAAGLGIDLTAGSIVIHYDRWWNAARENQATDRVHRIGQKRGVQVFKLVTKDTFEERIDNLISQKAELMEEVVSVDDHDTIKRFSRKDLMEFLQDSKSFERLMVDST